MAASFFNRRRAIGFHYFLMFALNSGIFLIIHSYAKNISDVVEELPVAMTSCFILNIVVNPICFLILLRNKTDMSYARPLVISGISLIVVDLYESVDYCIRNGSVSITIASVVLVIHSILLVYVFKEISTWRIADNL